MSKQICVCVQARLSSKRLPEKVLKKVNELNILELLTKRLSKARDPSQIYILTSNDKSDNKLVKFCQSKGLKFFRGDLDNVYKRYRDFLKINNYQALVRISADSPLLDDKILNFHPPIELEHLVYVNWDEGYPESSADEIRIRDVIEGVTMRSIWLSANRIYKIAKEEYDQSDSSLDSITLSDDPDETRFHIYFGS